MYKNRNGVLFLLNKEEDDIIYGTCITIAGNIRGKYYGYLIFADFQITKFKFKNIYSKIEEDEDYKNIIDLVFSVKISDER